MLYYFPTILCMVFVSFSDFKSDRLFHHSSKKVSTISLNHGVIKVPSVLEESEMKSSENVHPQNTKLYLTCYDILVI